MEKGTSTRLGLQSVTTLFRVFFFAQREPQRAALGVGAQGSGVQESAYCTTHATIQRQPKTFKPLHGVLANMSSALPTAKRICRMATVAMQQGGGGR